MNILITGGNGQPGNEMRRVSENSLNHYLLTDVAELDITDPVAIRKTVADHQISVIVNCAAYTNVDRAENELRSRQKQKQLLALPFLIGKNHSSNVSTN